MFYWGLRSVVVITSASQAEGRRFEPSRKHSVYSTSAVFDYLDFFKNCFTSCILRVMKIFSSNSNLEKLVPRLSFFVKKVRLSSLHSSKTFLKATEHSWTKTILSTGGRRTLFNSRLMNKLIRIEWVIAIQLPTKLIDVTSSMSKNLVACQFKTIIFPGLVTVFPTQSSP